MNSSFNNKGDEQMDKNATIKRLWGTMSFKEIGEVVGLSNDSVRKRGNRMGLETPKPSAKEEVNKDVARAKEKRMSGAKDEKYREALKQLETLTAKLQVYEGLDKAVPYNIKPTNLKLMGDATAVALFSDFHYGEVVRADGTMGTNTYNCAIAKQRAEAFFKNVVKIVHDMQQHSKIDRLVLGLLGDLITGEIHEVLAETNEVLSMEATVDVYKIVEAGIRHVLNNTDVKLIDVPCVVGNHSRNTKKVHTKNGNEHSYESIVYKFLRGSFEGEPRIKFHIPDGEWVVLLLNDKKFKLRFSHGHQIRYIGGTGGVQAPAARVINGWQSYDKVDLDCIGHHHSFFATSQFVCNGSVVGSSEYGASCGFRFEPAQQAFFLVDHKLNRRTTTCPVFVE